MTTRALPLLVLLAACGSDARTTPDDDRTDGDDDIDGAPGSNAAEGECALVRTFRMELDTDSAVFFETREYAARFDGEGGAQSVRARLCDWEPNGSPASACAAGYTCSGAPALISDCDITASARDIDGDLYVSCGTEQDSLTDPEGGDIQRTGGHWTSISVEIN